MPDGEDDPVPDTPPLTGLARLRAARAKLAATEARICARAGLVLPTDTTDAP
jgi:hypothetical protein